MKKADNMTKEIANHLEKVRFQMIEEINKIALKLNGKIKSDFPNTIPLDFDDETLRLSDGLRSYPFLKINKNEVFLVFADEDYQEKYLNAYHQGTLEMKLEGLDMFSADELYNLSLYLDSLFAEINENDFATCKF